MSALKPVHSSWIAFHGYSNGTMTLITKSGESYAAKIPETRYTDFIKSPSQGNFFNLYIKPFATVTKVDVTEDVALVEAAKQRLTLDKRVEEVKAKLDALATPSTVNSRTYKVPRKAPAKSLLPHKPAPKGATDAWIDFRCIADPTTGPGLVKALKRFIELKGRDRELYAHYIPYMGYHAPAGQVEIAALGDWGGGYVNPKYLKAYPEGVTDHKALANAYRAAYRSWVRREEAKKAKVKAASGPVKGEAYAWVSTPKTIEAIGKEVFAGGWTGKTAEQARAERAEGILVGLEAGHFSVNVTTGDVVLRVNGNSFNQWRGKT